MSLLKSSNNVFMRRSQTVQKHYITAGGSSKDNYNFFSRKKISFIKAITTPLMLKRRTGRRIMTSLHHCTFGIHSQQPFMCLLLIPISAVNETPHNHPCLICSQRCVIIKSKRKLQESALPSCTQTVR